MKSLASRIFWSIVGVQALVVVAVVLAAGVSSARTSIVPALAAFALGLVAAHFASRALARPFERLEQSAAALARGELHDRLRVEGPEEVRRLAERLDAIAREHAERLARSLRARDEIETILASMAEGVVAVDADERVLLMNHSAARLLGLSAALEAGQELWQAIRFPELERSLRAALEDGVGWHGDASSPRADGRTLALSVAPVTSTSRRDDEPAEEALFHGAVALLSDVTAIRRLEQVRIDFVANVSHELRTPLASVMGALETLSDADDETVRTRFLDIANRNAVRLQAIVSDLLDLSTIEAEGDEMPSEKIRVDAPLRTAANLLASAAEAKGLRLELPPPLAQPAWVDGNAQRLEQVFTNLLENAIKYTPHGGTVGARVRAGPREIAIDVYDDGLGIPTAALPRIFERFYRVDRSRAREMGGTGLGLAIVKHVLRAHGGSVSVTSEEGRGSTFTVTLPRFVERESLRQDGAQSA